MACYPIILLVAGLKNHDDTVALSGTIKHLVEMKNACNDKSDSNFPMPRPSILPDFPKYNENFVDINYYDDDINHVDSIESDITPIPNHVDSIESDITPIPLNVDKSEKLMKIFEPEYQVKAKSKKVEPELFKNIYDDELTELFLPEYQVKTKSEKVEPELIKDIHDDKLMELFVPEYQVKSKSKKVEPELLKNIYDDFEDKPMLLRERQNSIAIPTVEDAKTLLKILKSRAPLIAVSINLIKKLTNMKYREIISNPFFSDVSDLVGKKKSFLGVSTFHLVYLIIDTLEKLHDTKSKSLKPFVKQFGNILEAALDFIEEPKPPVALKKRGILQKIFG